MAGILQVWADSGYGHMKMNNMKKRKSCNIQIFLSTFAFLPLHAKKLTQYLETSKNVLAEHIVLE